MAGMLADPGVHHTVAILMGCHAYKGIRCCQQQRWSPCHLLRPVVTRLCCCWQQLRYQGSRQPAKTSPYNLLCSIRHLLQALRDMLLVTLSMQRLEASLGGPSGAWLELLSMLTVCILMHLLGVGLLAMDAGMWHDSMWHH